MRGLLAVVAVAGALAAPTGAASQVSTRIQASWTDDTAWGLHVGWEGRSTLGEEGGGATLDPGIADVSPWMLTAMLAVGAVDARDDGLEASLYGHAGVLRRLGGARLGVVGATLPVQGAAGPAVRGEVGDVAMVQLGWLFAPEGAGGFHAALDLQLAFLTRVVLGRDP